MSMIKYPYTNLHEINLDWLIEKVKEAYSPDNPPDMAVLSVNGMTGNVTLYTDPAVVLPAIQGNSWNIGRTANGTTVGIKFNKTLPAQRMNGSSLFNIYDEGNPPPYPVTSVNGRTGAVQVQEAFFSLNGSTITFITDSPGHFWALDRATQDGSISLKLDTTNNTPSAYLEYLSADESVYRSIKLLTPDDIPSSSGVVSVNGMAGVVSLDAENIPRSGSDSENVNHALNTINTKIGNVGNTSLQAQLNTLNDNTAKSAEKRVQGGETANFTFSSYNTAALIFGSEGDSDAILYVYSNGYLVPVKTSSRMTVTLSQDYKTITVAVISGTGHIGCISSSLQPIVS